MQSTGKAVEVRANGKGRGEDEGKEAFERKIGGQRSSVRRQKAELRFVT